MPTFNCGSDSSALLAYLVNPSVLSSFYNPLYQEPTSPLSAFTIDIYVDGTPTNFSRQYKPKSMRIEENIGFEKGMCTFELWDDDPTSLYFTPRSQLYVEIWNQNKTGKPFFKGLITKVDPTTIVRRANSTDFSEHKVLKVICQDETYHLTRRIVVENYENFTSYQIVSDLITRFTRFTPVIDTSLGITHESFRVNNTTVAQAIQRLLDIELDATVRLDKEAGEFYFGPKAAVTNQIMTITDETYVNYFNPKTFKINTDSRAIRNRVKFPYNKKYTVGKANVSQNNVTVLANTSGGNPNPRWLSHIKAPCEFKIPGASGSAVYSVVNVNSDTELTLSSDYLEVDGTDVDYEVGGSRGLAVATDWTSIQAMASILGETGPGAGLFEYVVPEDSNYYTEEEAQAIVDAHLLRFSTKYLYDGKGETTNMSPIDGIPTGIDIEDLTVGQMIDMDLPVTRGIKGQIVIQQIVWKDTGATITRSDYDSSDTRIDPLFKINLDFTDRIFATRNTIKRLQQDQRKARVNDDDILSDTAHMNEFVFVEDCVHVVPNEVMDDNELEISDSFNIRDNLSTGPWYTAPATGLHEEGYTLGFTGFSKAA